MAVINSRPNPDELLARIKTEEAGKKRGKLKIFLGYAPGVGKTYAMLEAARERKKDTDVVIAYVETHGRAETEALLEGLEVIPRRQVEYRGIKLSEMDIDAVLKRHPRLALVDELAHENAAGSRNTRRYQDVDELLEAGIDVNTTLNVQHIESGRNVVAQITGVWVRETVPDSFIDTATEIELVDLPPDELLKRLSEGKVYIPEQIVRAREQFFRKGNLTALRELCMRTADKHVDEQTFAYMKAHAIQGPWASGERILLFIGPGSSDSRVVRSARRLVYELGAEWFAVNVDTPGSAQLSSELQDEIVDSLRLAQRLGAKMVTLEGASVGDAVMEFARTNNITKIVVARPQSRLLAWLSRASIVGEIVRRSEVDVYLVNVSRESVKQKRKPGKANTRWRGYLLGTLLIVLITVLGQLERDIFIPTTMLMMYMMSVVVTAYLWGLGPSILVSVLGVLAFDFFLVPPYLSFSIEDTQHIFTFFVLLLVGVIISYLTSRVRQQSEAARLREHQMAALYALGRDLAISNDLESYIRAIISRAKETFGYDTVIFLPDPQNQEILKLYSLTPNVSIEENEMGAAIWAFRHQKVVGHGTDTLPNVKSRYIPLVTARGTVGVIALLSDNRIGELTIEQERLLGAYTDLAAVAIESVMSGAEAHNTPVLREPQ